MMVSYSKPEHVLIINSLCFGWLSTATAESGSAFVHVQMAAFIILAFLIMNKIPHIPEIVQPASDLQQPAS